MNPPGWDYHLLAIDLFLRRQYQQMRALLERAESDTSGFTNLLIAMADGELGNRDATRAALEELSKFTSLASDPAAYMRRHKAVDDIVYPLVAGLGTANRIASTP